jgi:hypothetical protein
MDTSFSAKANRRYATLLLLKLFNALERSGLLFLLLIFFCGPSLRANAGQADLTGPFRSGAFGSSVVVLPNGNFIVSDPGYDAALGAVYLYDGTSLALLGTLTGQYDNDRVGSGGIIVLRNGNFLVNSTNWNNGAGAVTWVSGTSGLTGAVSATNSLVGISTNSERYSVTVLSNGNYIVSSPYWNNGLGAVTWANGMTGITGVISAENSLVGIISSDNVGSGVTVLSNGNYVVSSPSWNNFAGAATWASGTTGVTGIPSAANSLVGTASGDSVGDLVTALNNGNYVVSNSEWHNGSAANAGAATWGNGTTGIKGIVSTANSLVGSQADDQVGDGVTPLNNGNYVVNSTLWHNGSATRAGAATWGNGTTGVKGVVSATNSLVGSQVDDDVGSVVPLNNGNYVMISPFWANGSASGAGAVSWGNGLTGTTGVVSSANSLVGGKTGDQIGYDFRALNNGNYLVVSRWWDNAGGVVDAGAVTWGSGVSGIAGLVSSANSLVGTTANDQVGGSGAVLLSNGNYVVPSPLWDNTASVPNAGAVTWGSGTTGVKGVITAANSLIGATANDYAGNGVIALNNGNYVVSSPNWHNGSTANAGAATWCSGTTGRIGAVTAANSLVGTTANDYAASSVTAFTNGNYVVSSQNWHNGGVANVGALTWADGAIGRTGSIAATNSLVGSTADDIVGSSEITFLNNGNYAVITPTWDNGAVIDAGAVTWGDGTLGTTGLVTTANSILGTVAYGGGSLSVTNDPVYNRILAGYPAGNRVSLLGFTPHLLVQQPTNINLANGSTRIFGAPVGTNVSLSFTLKNSNLGDLTGIGVTITGTDASQFSATSSPSSFLPGPFGVTNFTVQFAPTSTGTKTAVLHIASNDAAQNPFNINLSGKPLSFNEDSDGDGMSDAAEFALAPLGFDWQTSQPGIVNTYYASANGAGLYTSNQIQALSVNSPLLAKDPQTGVFTLTIGVQKSTNLLDFIAFPMSAPQTTINPQGELQFQFNVPDNAAFFRLESH